MIAVAVAGSQRSDCCGDTSAEQSLSWRLSLTGGWLDGRGDTCTRADVSVSISFVLLSIVLTKVCLMNVSDPDTGRITRAHQTGEGLLHAWESKDCSLFTNTYFYAPIRSPLALPWPSPAGRA